MKSPRFDIRAAPLRQIFSPANIERIWREKVRISMRQQILIDGIEHFDFHVQRAPESRKLSQLILSGDYSPDRAQRILVEKSKGLCRQLVIPTVKDALVLQCLSDALYQEIRDKAPTDRSFFEPRDHRFSANRDEYGTFASWLNFQRELFKFSKNRKFMVITDIANYYDSISYEHLRNVISSITGAQECVLDMLIYVLSSLLWQPDYSPRVEIGLPQMNFDAPRLLAHCFLYELDSYLASDPNRDFVRYMDDIDVGVDTIVAARKTLQAIDLVLQTKQIRLNSGKTQILTQEDAAHHFRVIDNMRLDAVQAHIERRIKQKKSTDRAKGLLQTRIRNGLANASFDQGNGDKILKRLLGLAAITRANIAPSNLSRLILHRPSVREKVLDYVRAAALTPARARMLAECAESGHLIDDAALVDLCNSLVETLVTARAGRHDHIKRIADACNLNTFYGVYSRLWIQSKYDTSSALLETIKATRRVWGPHDTLGRLIGALEPLFSGSERREYIDVMIGSRNQGFVGVAVFHKKLASTQRQFTSMFDALKQPNFSRGTGITHPKFLCLLSALKNDEASAAQKSALRKRNKMVFEDVYYRRLVRLVAGPGE